MAFASGVPFALVNDTAALLYRTQGVDLKAVGLLSILGWAWSIKFLWAPAVDRVGTRVAWTVGMQVAIAATLLGISFLPHTSVTTAAWVLFALLALCSATQDVAVDAYAIDVLPSRWVGPASGVRVLAYRTGLILAGGTLLARADALGWSGIWQVAAGCFVVAAVFSLRLPRPPRSFDASVPQEKPGFAVARPLVLAIRYFVARPGGWALVLFVILFKVGDQAMAPMTKPFLLDRGLSLQVVGDFVTPLMIVATVAGALLGGWLTRRWGVFTALWTLGLAQALSNLGYAAAAFHGEPALLWVAATVEPFCGGLGTAPFLTLGMLSVDKAQAATQFALLTAVYAFAGRPVGAFSGWAVEALGYAGWFLVTFALALPAFVLLPWVKRWVAALPAPPEGSPASA